jgi:KDO2-lipid IV(A) lauroyltransferase
VSEPLRADPIKLKDLASVAPQHLVKDLGGLAMYDALPHVVQRASRPTLIRLADRLGDLVMRSAPRDVAVMRAELGRTLGDDLPAPADVLIRRAFRQRMLIELEVLRFPALGPHNISGTAVLEGREHLEAALAKGRGAVVMIGHFGANQMIMPALGYAGYRMNQISAPPTAWFDVRDDGRANPLWKRVQIARWGLEQTLPTQHISVFGFLRPAYECLERNEILGLACDGGGGSRWVPMPLGRRVAFVPTQPWQLARTTGAAIVPCQVVREGRQVAHRVILEPAIEMPHSRDKMADVALVAQRFGARMTAWVRARPCHYLPYLLLRYNVRRSDAVKNEKLGVGGKAFFEDYPEADPS